MKPNIVKRIFLMTVLLISVQLSVIVNASGAAIIVKDDAGNIITLAQPALRVVTMAPHITELIFAAGGGSRIVGTVKYSDYPVAAKSIPRIGDNSLLDIERLIALKPDLLVVWRHNSADRQLEQLRKLGIPLFYSDPRKLRDIPDSIIRLGRLLGTTGDAEKEAAALGEKIDALAFKYQKRPRVRVFYQVWSRPLYTLNGSQIVSDAINVCGGENIFAHLSVTAPVVNIEAVLVENPEVLISGQRKDDESDLDYWRSYSGLLAVHRNNLFGIDADLMNRAGPRLIDGTVVLCEKLALARSRRGQP
ncbi:cobalamin-binding protein [Glaciimonas sp. GNP009]|uniref:cobalamin-binding protein n=2 Tax=Glaciimonas TaxID=1229970 RepID=UPI002AB4363C|nr:MULTISPECIES: cobalamin-binding protein [unclassified Glaciimonas]MDY7548704.1 cobalamin-binding protein [Glaciimonas sp. CA11.2]